MSWRGWRKHQRRILTINIRNSYISLLWSNNIFRTKKKSKLHTVHYVDLVVPWDLNKVLVVIIIVILHIMLKLGRFP